MQRALSRTPASSPIPIWPTLLEFRAQRPQENRKRNRSNGAIRSDTKEALSFQDITRPIYGLNTPFANNKPRRTNTACSRLGYIRRSSTGVKRIQQHQRRFASDIPCAPRIRVVSPKTQSSATSNPPKPGSLHSYDSHSASSNPEQDESATQVGRKTEVHDDQRLVSRRVSNSGPRGGQPSHRAAARESATIYKIRRPLGGQKPAPVVEETHPASLDHFPTWIETPEAQDGSQIKQGYRRLMPTEGDEDKVSSLKELSQMTEKLLSNMANKNGTSSRETQILEDGQVGETFAEKAKASQRGATSDTQRAISQFMENLIHLNEGKDGRERAAKEKLRNWNRYSDPSGASALLWQSGSTKPLSLGQSSFPTAATSPSSSTSASPQAKDGQLSHLPITLESKAQLASKTESRPHTADNEDATVRISQNPSSVVPASTKTVQGTSLYDQLFGDSRQSSKRKLEQRRTAEPVEIDDEELIDVDDSHRIPLPGSFEHKQRMIAELSSLKHLAEKATATGYSLSNDSKAGTLLDPNSDMTVLMLYGVSPNLAEDDIRRLIPRGKHLPNWFTDDQIVHVFPNRDHWTLKRRSEYFLVFRTAAAAEAYKKAFHRMQAVVNTYTPRSLLSPPVPGKGFLVDGIDISAALSAFTVAVPHQITNLRSMRRPWDDFLSNIFARGGYPQIISKPGERRALVALEFDQAHRGYGPSHTDIFTAVVLDGARRGLPWRLGRGDPQEMMENDAAFTDGTIDSMAVTSSVSSVRKSIQYLPSTKPKDEEDLSQALQKSVHQVQQDRRNVNNAEDTRLTWDKLTGSRWLIKFQDHTEAKRFAYKWHMRPLPMSEHDMTIRGISVDNLPICKTEVLW